MLDFIDYTSDRDLAQLRLLEPGSGRGSFAEVVVRRLVESARVHGRGLDELAPAVRFVDIVAEHVEYLRDRIVFILRDAKYSKEDALKLSRSWVKREDYLMSGAEEKYDFVVGNPPYVRFEELDSRADEYRRRWYTMGKGADLYVGFYQKGLTQLVDGGRLAFICADRWMRNKYGTALRGFVNSEYSVDAVFTMHDVDAFETRVAAYPAVTVLSKAPQGPAVVANCTVDFGEAQFVDLIRYAKQREPETVKNAQAYSASTLPDWFEGAELWPSGAPEVLALLEFLQETASPIEPMDAGTKVSIGIATGADRIFIPPEPPKVEGDRLLPIAMGVDIRTGTYEWGGRSLVNPWDDSGQLIDLSEYPLTRRYFNDHALQLKSRSIGRRAGDGWYRTIDKINSRALNRPKLVLADMRMSLNPVLVPAGHYPHHNLNWIGSDVWDLRVLGGLLLSRVVLRQVEAYAVKMRGGTIRFTTQYLRQIRLPKPQDLSPELRDVLAHAFDERDEDAATSAAEEAYSLHDHW